MMMALIPIDDFLTLLLILQLLSLFYQALLKGDKDITSFPSQNTKKTIFLNDLKKYKPRLTRKKQSEISQISTNNQFAVIQTKRK